MSKIRTFILAVAAVLVMASCGSKADRLVLATEQDSLSWAMGASLAQTVQSDIFPFNNDQVREGFDRAMQDKPSKLNEKSYNNACQFIQFLTQMAQQGQHPHISDKAPADTISWAMGQWLAQTAKSGFYDFDYDIVRLAFGCILSGGDNKLDPTAFNAASAKLAQLAQQGQTKVAEKAEKKAVADEKELFAKLAAEHPNIQKHPSGFYYEVLREGKGPNAQPGQRIKFDFRGANMTTNEVYVQTYGERDPVIHVLGTSMFQGIYEGLQLMNAGSKYCFYFPHDIARGASGIPAYTPVSYTVELHEIFKN